MSEQTPTFLYIDDHPASRKVMKLLMEDVLGFANLTLLEDSVDIIQRLEALNTRFDIIFLDLHLEPLNGVEVCRLLRENQRFAQSIIVALTASMVPDELEAVRITGFNGLISKPINYQTLASHIERLLAGETIWEVE